MACVRRHWKEVVAAVVEMCSERFSISKNSFHISTWELHARKKEEETIKGFGKQYEDCTKSANDNARLGRG
jgi:hypothetical protein